MYSGSVGKISSPESAQVLSDKYDERVVRVPNINSDIEKVFSSTLIREEEQYDEFDMFDDLMDEYVRYTIKDVFGITFKEWLDTTNIARERMIERAKKIITQREQEAEELKNKLATVNRGLTNGKK